MAEELLAGRYLIHEELGRGASATVYRARDTVLERSVALKVIASGLASDPDFARRFEQEARLAARLDHPNVVLVHDVGTLPDGRAFIAMRLLEGKGLDNVIAERGQLTPNEVVSIVDQLAAALDYTHSTGLIHRDVKPSNVMVDSAGRATLTDFGIARALDSARVTLPGLTIGTPRYMSPEQVRGEDTSSATDVYSLAVMAYEMMAGRPPFDGDGTSLMYKIVHETPPPPNSFNPWLPPSVSNVIQQALQKAPGERWNSAGEFARALRDALATSTLGGAALAPSNAPTVVSAPPRAPLTNPPGTSGFASVPPPGTGPALAATDGIVAATQVASTGSEPILSAPTEVSRTGGSAAFAPSDAPTEVNVTGGGPAFAPTEVSSTGGGPVVVPAAVPSTGGAPALTEAVITPQPIVDVPEPPTPSPEPAASGGARPPERGGSSRKGGVLIGGLAALLLLGGGAVAALSLLGGGDDDDKANDDDDDRRTATSAPVSTRTQATGSPSATNTAVSTTGVTTVAVEGTATPGATSAPTSTPPPGSTNTPIPPPTATYTNVPGATATNTPIPTATPTPTTAPPTNTPVPAGPVAQITGITISGDARYQISFVSSGINPNGGHVHFFFNTTSVANAGTPGSGPWKLIYSTGGLFTGWTVAEKPGAATQMCILVANADHSIIPGTGNCWALPTQ